MSALAAPWPVTPPPLNIPFSSNIVNVSAIHTGARMTRVPVSLFFQPHIEGYDTLDIPSYSFLIEHASGDRLLFDLGMWKNWKDGAPAIVEKINEGGWIMDVPKDVPDVLLEHNVTLESINSIIWSHWHFDHLGDPSVFPLTTSLTVGPGFKSKMLPGYPTNPDSLLVESAWEGRELVEVPFDQGPEFRIGRFRAFDYFGDGSFYLLDSPGHAVGHICGLARTTPDTFLLLGGDVAHHGGEIRPTQYLPIPELIFPNPLSNVPHAPPCPGSLFVDIHPEHSATKTFFHSVAGDFTDNYVEAQRSIEKLGEVEGHPNVFTVIAHDKTLLDVLDFFPRTLNDWKAKGFRERGMWKFLKDFEGAIDSADDVPGSTSLLRSHLSSEVAA